jgi:ferric-dicitrate binding protein FerR (iron transport regulator)
MTCRAARLAVAVLFLAPLLPAARAQGVAAVVETSGDVAVLDASGATRPISATPGTDRIPGGSLASGDEIRTGDGASAHVRFADGTSVRAGAAARVGVAESAAPADPGAPRVVRRSVRLSAGRIRVDCPASETALTEVSAPAGRVAVTGAQASVAWSEDRLRVAVDGGRAAVEDASGALRAPLGIGQSIDLQPDGAAFLLRVPADAGRPIRAVIRSVRVDLSAGDALRIAAGADGIPVVTVLAGPVQIVRGEASPRTVQAGESFPATAGDIEMPAIRPRAESEKPAPPPARPATDAARRAAEEVPIPPLPEVRAIEDTVEASPVK